RVAVLLSGGLTRVAPLTEVMEGGSAAVEIRCAGAPVLDLPAGLAGVLEHAQRAGETVLRLSDDARLNDVLAWLVRAGVAVRAVTPQRPGLETLLLEAAGRVEAGERRAA